MKESKIKRYEVDLFEPVRQYFIKQGYIVHAEVNDCDIVAIKGEELIIIELKKSLTIDLLIQATKRQRLTKIVYIAIPKPAYSLHSKKWKDLCYLVRRLELGLVIVSFQDSDAQLTIVFQPEPFDRVKSMGQSKKKRNKMLLEIEGRHANYNIGGSTQTTIMTAYKEICIHIACCLERFGPLSPKALRQLGTGEKTQSVLSKNHHGWFEKISRGIYHISEKGVSEFKGNPAVSDYYYKLITENLKNRDNPK